MISCQSPLACNSLHCDRIFVPASWIVDSEKVHAAYLSTAIDADVCGLRSSCDESTEVDDASTVLECTHHDVAVAVT